jgi:hypothetical protein
MMHNLLFKTPGYRKHAVIEWRTGNFYLKILVAMEPGYDFPMETQLFLLRHRTVCFCLMEIALGASFEFCTNSHIQISG